MNINNNGHFAALTALEPVLDHAQLNDILQTLTAKLSPRNKDQFNNFLNIFIERSQNHPFWQQLIPNIAHTLFIFWLFQRERKHGEIKVKVFNPNAAIDGFSSEQTLVFISQTDAPFIVDSLQMLLNRLGYDSQPIISLGGIWIKRQHGGALKEVFASDPNDLDTAPEAPVFLKINKLFAESTLQHFQIELQNLLQELHQANNDWQLMRERCQDIIEELETHKRRFPSDEARETITFLKWLLDDHFIFLGYRQYTYEPNKSDPIIRLVSKSGYGLLRDESKCVKERRLSTMPEEAQRLARSDKILIVTKTNTKSWIHRPTYTDYIGVKYFDDKGSLIGEHRFIGLFTATAYNDSLKNIPFLRQKASAVLNLSKLPINGHSGKSLLNILETFPRDDLFQISIEELYNMTMAMLHMRERKAIRLFARKDSYGRFYSCIIFIPREKITSELIQKFETILMEALSGIEASVSVTFGDSALARLHYVIRIAKEDRQATMPNFEELENLLAEAGKSWQEKLKEELLQNYSEEEALELLKRYQNAFSISYQEDFAANQAVHDIRRLEGITEQDPLAMTLFQSPCDSKEHLRFKLFQLNEPISLSSIIPVLENMGLIVLEERPYQCTVDKKTIWICDYYLRTTDGAFLDLDISKPLFQSLFMAIWHKHAENDHLNALVLSCQVSWQLVTVLRAYCRYMKQIGVTYSQPYLEEVFNHHYGITKQLLTYFALRFDPLNTHETDLITTKSKILTELSKVSNLDEDKILRSALNLIEATIRTTYFKSPRPYLAFKFKSGKIFQLPLPHPFYEIFVYSPHFEAIHLRASKVARGGIRWSDRREDFRTEVLGLMKAQQVKNTVIVPAGSKGGFVLKNPINKLSREELLQEGVNCYQNFMRAMLDLTDNILNQEIVFPSDVKRYDEEDPYLVVAADKGTATFSDYANQISEEYNFWLGDAFASGGSQGYDHKKIGITARGAWISVEAHFKTLRLKPDHDIFTAIGIGDMSGDVFGNGALRSNKMKLVAAFNHQHIFIDPTPDPEASYQERLRLFNLPRSTWQDYQANLISPGGGIFERSAKNITLTPEIKQLLQINDDSLEPSDLIKAILKAPVDLLFNGGIGTYVKSSTESNANVGDKANDALRVNGNELCCKIVGEGGNLGFTQLGRVEFAQKGGLIFTDFIDNSAGVDLSDHEVNIKILLAHYTANQQLSIAGRNQLLKDMTNDVAHLVLEDNKAQTEILSFATSQAASELEVYARCLKRFENEGLLDRNVEFLPSEQELDNRFKTGLGLTAPEIAVILAYVKMDIKQNLLKSNVPDDNYFFPLIEKEFPAALNEHYQEAMHLHRLRRELVTTQLTNQFLNETSLLFVQRLAEETNAKVSDIVRAYAVIREVFDLPGLLAAIASLDYKVDPQEQVGMRVRINRFIRRATRWLLHRHLGLQNIQETIDEWKLIKNTIHQLPEFLRGVPLRKFNSLSESYKEIGVPHDIAERIAAIRSYYALLDINAIALKTQQDPKVIAQVYFTAGDSLNLGWLREEITNQVVNNQWEALAHSSQRDDLDRLQATLVHRLLQKTPDVKNGVALVNEWLQDSQNHLLNWHILIHELQRASKTDYIMYTVALKTLSDVIELTTSS